MEPLGISSSYSTLPDHPTQPSKAFDRDVTLRLQEATREGDLKTMCQLLDTRSVSFCKLSDLPENVFHIAVKQQNIAALNVLIDAYDRYRVENPEALDNPLDEADSGEETPLENALNPSLLPPRWKKLTEEEESIHPKCVLALINAGASLFHYDRTEKNENRVLYEHLPFSMKGYSFFENRDLFNPSMNRINVLDYSSLESMIKLMKEKKFTTVYERGVRQLLRPLLHSDIQSIVLSYVDMSGKNQLLRALNPKIWEPGTPIYSYSAGSFRYPTSRLKFLIDSGFDVDRPLINPRLDGYITLRDVAKNNEKYTKKHFSYSIAPEICKIILEAPVKAEKWDYPASVDF